MKIKLLFSLLLFLQSLFTFADKKAEVMDIITRVNNAWQQSHGAPEYGGTKAGLSAFWDNAVKVLSLCSSVIGRYASRLI